MLVKEIKFFKLLGFNISCQNSPVAIPALNVTSEFIMQKSEYVGNLSFISSSIFIQLSNKLLRMGGKKTCFTVSWVSFYFWIWSCLLIFAKAMFVWIMFLLVRETTLKFASFKLNCQDLGLLAGSIELETEDAT